MRRGVRSPAVPGTTAGYSGTLLPKKLGIRAGHTTALVGAPAGFEKLLTALPDGARSTRRTVSAPDVLLLFARTQAELKRWFPAGSKRLAKGGKLWLCWPKQGSGVQTDLNGNDVRAFGLARGWVDFKVCAIDATWSGLCFSKRAARA